MQPAGLYDYSLIQNYTDFKNPRISHFHILLLEHYFIKTSSHVCRWYSKYKYYL